MFSEWLQQTWLRLKTLWKRPELDRDLGEEVAFHLAMREEKNRLAGVDPEEARYAARRQFGNTSALKENSREVWTFAALESFCQDLRFGARTLRKNWRGLGNNQRAECKRCCSNLAKVHRVVDSCAALRRGLELSLTNQPSRTSSSRLP